MSHNTLYYDGALKRYLMFHVVLASSNSLISALKSIQAAAGKVWEDASEGRIRYLESISLNTTITPFNCTSPLLVFLGTKAGVFRYTFTNTTQQVGA